MESNEWLSCRDCGPELEKQRFTNSETTVSTVLSQT